MRRRNFADRFWVGYVTAFVIVAFSVWMHPDVPDFPWWAPFSGLVVLGASLVSGYIIDKEPGGCDGRPAKEE